MTTSLAYRGEVGHYRYHRDTELNTVVVLVTKVVRSDIVMGGCSPESVFGPKPHILGGQQPRGRCWGTDIGEECELACEHTPQDAGEAGNWGSVVSFWRRQKEASLEEYGVAPTRRARSGRVAINKTIVRLCEDDEEDEDKTSQTMVGGEITRGLL